MSSDFNYILSLLQIQRNLYRFGGPILIAVGTVSCILSLIVFMKKNLRKNPCSIYLVAFNISNFLLIYTSIVFSTLSTGYNIDPSLQDRGFCRFRFYAMLLFNILSPSYLILASIDRVLITSPNARTRQRSTPRLAYIGIISITVFWLLAHIHALILTDLLQVGPGFFICYYRSGTHIVLVSYYSLIIRGILVPLLMVILGLWAIKNVRRVNRGTPASAVPASGAAIVAGVRTTHSKDRQLLKILLVDIIVYIVFHLMISVILLDQQFIQKQSGTVIQASLQLVLANIGVFSTFIPFCVACYTNLLVSKAFRCEVRNVLTCK